MTSSSSTFVSRTLSSTSTGTDVPFNLLHPGGPVSRPLPLIVHLHGAMSSAASLENARPAYEQAWGQGVLPPALVVCASTPTVGGFYIDQPGGPAWERLVADELPRHLAEHYPLSGVRAAIGFSMGGYAALKLALRPPHAFTAVAALCPAIFPAESAEAVPEANRPSVLGLLNQAMGDGPQAYRHNCVHSLARGHAATLRDAATRLYIDCGTADEFRLHDGAEHLHAVLTALRIPHRFRSVPGAGHADAHAAARQDEALRFLGAALA